MSHSKEWPPAGRQVGKGAFHELSERLNNFLQGCKKIKNWQFLHKTSNLTRYLSKRATNTQRIECA
ncbi:MAG: hypothetical protein AAFP09_16445, partial [Cyanobacteria bacterium J06607_10]